MEECNVVYGFKAFFRDKDTGELFCKPKEGSRFDYKIGETYEHNGIVKCTMSGFHFCRNPYDVFRYYPSGSVVCRVEARGFIDHKRYNSACGIITIKEVFEFNQANLTNYIRTLDDICSSKYSVLRIACENNHVEAVKWFCTDFHIELLRYHYMHAFCGLCAFGHLELAKWFAAYLQITAADLRLVDLTPLCMNGNFEMAEWLAAHFQLKGDDALQ